MAIAFVASPLVALARLYAWPVVRWPLKVYVEAFRLTPLLVQLIFFLYFAPVSLGVNIPVLWLAVIPLSLNVTAYLSEVWRGGLSGVATGQREAALATGMTPATVLRRIVVPMAFRQNIPMFAMMWVSLFKDSALAGLVGVHEMLYNAKDIANSTFRPLETFTIAALVYFLVTFPQSVVAGKVDEHFRAQD
jgi:polar amino acid transport system permease protein